MRRPLCADELLALEAATPLEVIRGIVALLWSAFVPGIFVAAGAVHGLMNPTDEYLSLFMFGGYD